MKVCLIVITFYLSLALLSRQLSELLVFESSCHLSTCLPHTVETSNCFFIAERQASKLQKPIFIVFGLSGRGIKPMSIVS